MNLTHKEVRAQMERVKQQLRALVAEGRGEEAIDVAFAMLEQLQDRISGLTLEVLV